MIIGTFKPTGSTFAGTIETLSFKAEAVFEPIAGKSEKSPDFRVTSGHADLGVAWRETSQATGKPYLSVRLDDPSFPAPIYCRLVETRDAHSLMWSREPRRSNRDTEE